jgi:hypothetical protein
MGCTACQPASILSATLKKHVVANQAIIDQRLVASRRFNLEIVLVTKFHLHAASSDRGTRNFGVELEHNDFGWFDADDEIVLRQLLDRSTLPTLIASQPAAARSASS